MLRNVGFGWRICLRTGWKIEAVRRERGICTRESEAGSREIVTSVGIENELDIDEEDEEDSVERAFALKFS
jgi:hypothetical protein